MVVCLGALLLIAAVGASLAVGGKTIPLGGKPEKPTAAAKPPIRHVRWANAAVGV